MALHKDRFILTAVRVVVFTPEAADFNPSALLAAVLSKYAKRFDGTVQAMPLPAAASDNLPRVALASKDRVWTFTASPSRLTSSWVRSEQETDQPVPVHGVVKHCWEPIEDHVRENNVRVGRLGLVVTRVCRTDNPAQVLVDRFCRDDVKALDSPDAPLRHSTNFEIHNHKRYEPIPGLTVNSWVRCRTATLGEDASPIVLAEQDINTLSEELEEREFSLEEIASFCRLAVDQMDSILVKYFP